MAGEQMNNQELTRWYIQQLTGDEHTVIDWRMIHDQRKDIPAHVLRGSVIDRWEELQSYNTQGYGIFCSINQLDGQGRELPNVSHIRTHVVDLDNPLTSQANFERACADGAAFAVQTSPGKYHAYWKITPYTGNEFFTLIQRKLAQHYGGDKTIIDATRVMRVPGFLHQKGEPFLSTCWELPGKVLTCNEMQDNLQAVHVVEHFATRSPLGEPSMQAPTLDWLKFAMGLMNPNDMDRGEWLSMSAAIKQAGWNHADEKTLHSIWSEWCGQYGENDDGENRKLWNSINDTEVGWTTIERRSTVKAYMDFGHKEPPALEQIVNQQQEIDTSGEILSAIECAEWFKGCYFVEREGKIFSSSGRFMNSTQFNGRFGGKQFIISSAGKLSDEPWKAALRSTVYQIPKVDHTRFIPDIPAGEIVEDALGRKGLNTYIPAKIDAREGNLDLWFDHVNRILPDPGDQKVLFEFMAHNVKFPGYKIPWAPMLQSAEGIGKTVFSEIMQHALGKMYVYSPKAQELVKSGSVFNGWMRGKLMIMVNEIKIDEKRELIEILKPMITDKEVEVQSKGVDQDMEDNPANWWFFSNYKDAIPISQNGRRYSILYSILQSYADIMRAGMDDAYFDRLWSWLRDSGGYEAVTYWLLNYPIERGGIPFRAPKTSSYDEALTISRSPMEIIIAEGIEDQITGFRGGFISTLAVIARCKAAGIRKPASQSIRSCLENTGYVYLGRAVRPYIQEDIDSRAEIYSSVISADIKQYGVSQGYE